MADLKAVHGIGQNYGDKLRKLGMKSTSMLLKKGALSAGRKEIANKLGVSESLILDWVTHCNFLLIKGMRDEYVDLLKAAGVDTLPALAMYDYDPQVLLRELAAVNAEKNLVRKLPTIDQLRDWIAQAKALPWEVVYEEMHCRG